MVGAVAADAFCDNSEIQHVATGLPLLHLVTGALRAEIVAVCGIFSQNRLVAKH